MGTVGKTFRVARARFRVWAEPCPTGVQCIRGTPSLRRVSQYDGPASPSLASPPTALTRSSTHATTCPLSSRMHISPPLALSGTLAASPAGAALDADRSQATAPPSPTSSLPAIRACRVTSEPPGGRPFAPRGPPCLPPPCRPGRPRWRRQCASYRNPWPGHPQPGSRRKHYPSYSRVEPLRRVAQQAIFGHPWF